MKQGSPFVIWLESAEARSISQVGSKAAHLAHLLHAGLPVPMAFCITTEAYRYVLDTLGIARQDDTTSAGVPADASLIEKSPLPSDLQEQILAAYHRLTSQHGPASKVAVRSSASAEDLPESSFAGQYTSVLNIHSEDHLLQAIKQCWASASTRPVQAYRTGRGLSDSPVQMAVLVQVMVPAEFAGVLFTVDPVTGIAKEIVIEMSPGLGDDLIAGKQMPLRLSLNRRTARPTVMLGQPTWHSLGAANCDWAHLRDLALKIEHLFGSPQDIEWAYSAKQFWILQSRPITGRSRLRHRQIWTRANAGEIMPGVVTPLTWSIFKPMLQMAGLYKGLSPLTIHWRWRHPHGEWPDSPRLFRGRAYMELGSVYAAFGGTPGIDTDILHRMLGFEFDLCHPDELPQKKPRWHVMDHYRYLRFSLEMLGLTKTLEHKARRWLSSNKRAPLETASPSASHMEADLVLARIHQLMQEGARVLGLHLQCTSMAFAAFGLIDRLIRQVASPAEVQAFEAHLVADFQNMGTVQQSIAIWDLAQAARDEPAVAQPLAKLKQAEQVLATWRRTPGAGSFMQRWDAFMDRFGDRSIEEFELAVAHWDEDPSFVLQRIREILAHSPPDPRTKLEHQHQLGQVAKQQMHERIKSKRSTALAWVFDRLVATYQECVTLRENMKYCTVQRFNALRKAFLLCGQTLERQGTLRTCTDIFFLHHEEIRASLQQPTGNRDLQSLVDERRSKYEECLHSEAPSIWMVIDGQMSDVELPSQEDGKTLRGIGCSPGRVTAPAFILTPNRGDVTMPSGHILVAPAIDPGLTPLFLSASGLVTEIGGVLSHGATVAREYGLPAVVGVPQATQMIHEGQMITVDGLAGFVRLEPDREDRS